MSTGHPTHALTLRPWWAFAVAAEGEGAKRIENRSRPLPERWRRKPVAIHAGRWDGRDGAELRRARELGAPVDAWIAAGSTSSAIVAVVLFGDSRPPAANVGPWSIAGAHGWVIIGHRVIAPPVPCARGALGFWALPSEAARSVAARGAT